MFNVGNQFGTSLSTHISNFCGIVVAILKMVEIVQFSGHHYLPTYQILMISDNVEFLRYVTAILKMATVEIFQCRDIIIYPHIKFWWYRTMLNFCGIVVAILKMATGRNCSMSGINSGHHYLPPNFDDTYQILMISDNVGTSLSTHISNFCGTVVAILKMNQTTLNFCGIVVAILKMATGRNCSMSGINSEHHYLPTYQILMISDNVKFVWYCGGHFENGDR